MNVVPEQSRRPYRMRKRAATAAETAERILDATIRLHTERFHDEITLEAVAARAGVTVQTVLRRFQSRERLIDAATDHATAQVLAQRGQAPVGDVPGAIENLLAHYDEWGGAALRLLAQEDRVPHLRRITDRGREAHAEWVRRVFGPLLEGRPEARRLEAELIAVTDVYAWKVLHLDRHLDRAATAAALGHMVSSVLATEGKP